MDIESLNMEKCFVFARGSSPFLMFIISTFDANRVVPLPSTSGKSRFSLESPTIHVIILVVTMNGKGDMPSYIYIYMYFFLKRPIW